MNLQEFSNEFDSLIKINGLPYELDEYEKSVLLTEAQETLVTGLYNGTLKGVSLEETEELRRYLDDIITEDTIDPDDDGRFTLPKDTLFIIYETVNLNEGVYCKGNTEMSVYPARHDEWNRIKNNPFRGPGDRRAVRLDVGDNRIEIICKHYIKSYYLRYLRKPKPIILVNLNGTGLTIEGEPNQSGCELNSALHRYILRTAVQLCQAKYARQTS